jgi:hypothetical protein
LLHQGRDSKGAVAVDPMTGAQQSESSLKVATEINLSVS